MVNEACAPFDDPKLRNILIDIKKRDEQIIDIITPDELIYSGFDEEAREKAKGIVESFKEFIETNKDEITALQIIYNKPYGQRHLTYDQIKQVADAIEKPPYNLTHELLWQAYEQLEQSRVNGSGPGKLLTNIISLIRFTMGEIDTLQPFYQETNEKFEEWLQRQKNNGHVFTKEQLTTALMR